MNYKEILEKVSSSGKISIKEIKEIQHGQSLILTNGSIINCYKTGKYVVQGKN